MSSSVEVAVIGAGPYGLAATVHLRRAGVDALAFGDPMSFWREMPRGMKLRSNWSATHMVEPRGELSIDRYLVETGARFGVPVPLERFVDYGTWVQERAVPDVDRRRVDALDAAPGGFELRLSDGERLHARRAVVACGIGDFTYRPPEFGHLPPERVSHTGTCAEPAAFAGRRVAIVGAGQSALETAALLSEAGAEVDVLVRASEVTWLRSYSFKNMLGELGNVVYAPTDVGPLWYSRIVERPGLYKRFPFKAQMRMSRRAFRPACSHWVRVRLDDVRLHLGRTVADAREAGGALRLTLDDGRVHTCDHLMLGTGYRVDITRYPFLSGELLSRVRRVGGHPVLRRGLESSAGGLHFLGAPSTYSFGPTQRFVSGSWYAGRALAAAVAGRRAVAAAR